jgi:hypothetical protein
MVLILWLSFMRVCSTSKHGLKIRLDKKNWTWPILPHFREFGEIWKKNWVKFDYWRFYTVKIPKTGYQPIGRNSARIGQYSVDENSVRIGQKPVNFRKKL